MLYFTNDSVLQRKVLKAICTDVMQVCFKKASNHFMSCDNIAIQIDIMV